MRVSSAACIAILLFAASVTLGATLVSEGDDKGPVQRAGRPRPQVTYKGSSPYFKVNFDRFIGVKSCVWCHPKVTATWEKEESFHKNAFNRLPAESKKDPKCVKCHVTAFNKNGFYPFETPEKQKMRKMGYTWGGDAHLNKLFEGVQCEACHGPNCGNKYSLPRLIETCKKCHNQECPHFKEFDPLKGVVKLKHRKIGAYEKIDYTRYVGRDGCSMCHYPNFVAWKRDQGAHAKAFDVLDQQGRRNPACLKCHTTGFHRDGKYPLSQDVKPGERHSGYEHGGSAAANRKFQGVQCEACHGINCGTYTKVDQIKPQCLKCHSGECDNDSGFDFDKALDKVRHRPPPGYKSKGVGKVVIEWHDWKKGKSIALKYKMPILAVLSNPPDG